MFGLRYFGEFRSKYKQLYWRIEIAERGYVGTVSELAMRGDSPLSITWERRGDEFYAPVKGSEATINVVCEKSNFEYINLFTSDPRKFRVSVYRNTKLFWRGYTVSDLYSESFAPTPYEVSIKAVDGFSLLGNIKYPEPETHGRISLQSIVAECISLMDLDLDFADWLDLYTDAMDENISPLSQTYVDTRKVFFVYDKPTYRDMLELCISPFVAQIFQSSGAINIRRVVSLYNDTRPLSYYNVAADMPDGWLVTADGRDIVTHAGELISTVYSRPRIDSMWDDTINVLDKSTLEIVPPIKKVTVTVKNKLIEDILSRIGVYDRSKWDHLDKMGFYPYTAADGEQSITIGLTGSTESHNLYFSHVGHHVEKTSDTLEFEAKIEYFLTGGVLEGLKDAVFGFKLVSARGNRWVNDGGEWVETETYITKQIAQDSSSDAKLEIKGIPDDGLLVFIIKQTAVFNIMQGNIESLRFCDMKMTFKNDDVDSPKYETVVDERNNIDYEIQLPMADIDNIPNADLIYSLYPTNSAGVPTRLWHTYKSNDYAPLNVHASNAALILRQRPRKSIDGTLDTGKHIDMNTLIADDKYLNTAFYMNSIELSALDDEYRNELIELPDAMPEAPLPDGENCVTVCNLPFGVDMAVKCGSVVVIKSTGSKLFIYDPVSGRCTAVMDTLLFGGLFEGDNAAVMVTSGMITVIGPTGTIIAKKPYSTPVVAATWQGGKLYVVRKIKDTPSTFLLEIYTAAAYSPVYTPVEATRIEADAILSLRKSFATIALTATPPASPIRDYSNAYIYDTRVDSGFKMSPLHFVNQLQAGPLSIVEVSDYHAICNYTAGGGSFRIYRRNTLNVNDMVEIYSEQSKVYDMADSTPAYAAFASDTECHALSFKTLAKTSATGSGAIKGVFFINGTLFLVRDNKIDKFYYNR